MQCLKSKLSKKSCHLIEFLMMTWEREKRKAEKKKAENPGHGLQIKKLTFTTHLSFSFSLLLPSLLYSLRLCNWIKVGASLRPGASLMQRLLWVQVFNGAEAFLRLGLPCCRGFLDAEALMSPGFLWGRGFYVSPSFGGSPGFEGEPRLWGEPQLWREPRLWVKPQLLEELRLWRWDPAWEWAPKWEWAPAMECPWSVIECNGV